MANESQELAVSLLEDADEKGTLDPALKERLSKRFGSEIRQKVGEVLVTPALAENAPDVSEAEKMNTSLIIYRRQYDELPDDVKALAKWEGIAERLLENNGEKLKLANTMQGGGELFGVDTEGRALFKDKGTGPVMFGYGKKGKLLRIYDRDPEQMKQVKKWCNYYEIREQALKDGYELFADDGHYGLGFEMKQVEKHTGESFIASENVEDYCSFWLESGVKAVRAHIVYFLPDGGGGIISEANPEDRECYCGAIRLLRV